MFAQVSLGLERAQAATLAFLYLVAIILRVRAAIYSKPIRKAYITSCVIALWFVVYYVWFFFHGRPSDGLLFITRMAGMAGAVVVWILPSLIAARFPGESDRK